MKTDMALYRDKILEMAAAGCTVVEMADVMPIDRSVIRNWLVRNGVKYNKNIERKRKTIFR